MRVGPFMKICCCSKEKIYCLMHLPYGHSFCRLHTTPVMKALRRW
jgi:hypothetical protein